MSCLVLLCYSAAIELKLFFTWDTVKSYPPQVKKREGTPMTAQEEQEQRQRLREAKDQQSLVYTEIGQSLDRAIKTLQKDLNSGRPVDNDETKQHIAAITEDLKIQTKRLKDLDILREPPFEVPPEDTRFALEGYPIPSTILKFDFDSDLHASGMFTVFTDEETQDQFTTITGGAFAEEITELGHVRFVETMFSDNFDDDIAFTVMNAFFWILFFKGDTWIPVRSYAIEMLRLFPKAILAQYPIPEDFIETFSRFTRKVLASRGICSLKARPTSVEGKKGLYAIKATGAFKSLLEPTAEAMTKTLASTPE